MENAGNARQVIALMTLQELLDGVAVLLDGVAVLLDGVAALLDGVAVLMIWCTHAWLHAGHIIPGHRSGEACMYTQTLFTPHHIPPAPLPWPRSTSPVAILSVPLLTEVAQLKRHSYSPFPSPQHRPILHALAAATVPPQR